MCYVPIEELLKKTGSIYKLVNLAAKRALELQEGAPKLIESNSIKPSQIALQEILRGKITYAPSKKKA
jgi:DNA-directed RNA polymerase subunit omega